MAAEPLTLESLGVDLPSLARRIGLAQERANRSDTECAALAGVTAETWRTWKEGTATPGVARMPRLSAAASAPVSWLMFDADPLDAVPKSESEQAMNFARRAAALLAEVVPLVESVARIAAEVERGEIPIAGGIALSHSLHDSGIAFQRAAAVTSRVLREHMGVEAAAHITGELAEGPR